MTEKHRKELVKGYLDHLTSRVNDLDYTEIDGFCEEEDLNDEDVEYIQSLKVKVIINQKEHNHEP